MGGGGRGLLLDLIVRFVVFRLQRSGASKIYVLADKRRDLAKNYIIYSKRVESTKDR